MHQQHHPVVQTDQQIFRPPADGPHRPVLDPGRQADGQRPAQIAAALLDADDAPPFQADGQAATDGLDFGKFRHGRRL